MLQIQKGITEDFIDINKLYIGEHVIIYRAIRKADQKPVILKTLRADNPSPEELELLKHEFTILQHLKGVKGINLAIEMIAQPQLIIVEEDWRAISLKSYLESNVLTLDQFYTIAIKITEILGEIHDHRVIHKDINPANILIKPETLDIKIIDFSLASQLKEEMQEEINPRLLAGTLAYLAPERTGRMNRPIDYRCDFYSLGITFYVMLTRQLPFQSADPLELVYDHIAVAIPPVKDIPSSLAQLINKLVSKNPNDRYMSALGIRADLINCQANKEVVLGQSDALDQFHLSHFLYGREEQVKQILSFYRNIAQGQSEGLLLVTGYSGIGKTSLVREVHKPMTKENGIFIAGKFDQLKRSTPFYAFIEAFHQLIHQHLSQTEKDLALLRDEIHNAVGNNAQVIIEIIPDLEILIGKQSPIPKLPAQQAQNRFILTFQNFVKVFAKAEHPLIIFLDDLQWSDNASLKLMEALLSDKSLQYLFIIGTYRDNEVSPHHPLMVATEGMKKSGIRINQIVLQPLSKEAIIRLIEDSFPSIAFKCEHLAQIIHSKTLGNAFFVTQFLKLLYQEQILFFSKEKMAWEVNLEQIESLGSTANVIDLLIKYIHKLPSRTQELLQLAACIGHSFDINTLSLASNNSSSNIEKELWDPLHEGLISGSNYQKIELGQDIDKLNRPISTYKFSHDRIQQAAYTLIPQEARQKMQLTIGRLLLNDWKTKKQLSQLTQIMNLFRDCLDLITDPAEKHELASLFLDVGNNAKSSTAYEGALMYYQAGLTLLTPFDWQSDYALLFNLHAENGECEYLTGDLENAENQLLALVEKAKDRFDKAKVYHVMITMYNNLGQARKAIQIGLDSLKLFNVNLHFNPSKFEVNKEFLKLIWAMGNQKIEEMDKVLKPMTDPDKLAVVKTLLHIGDMCSQNDRPLFSITCFLASRLLFQYGYSPFSAATLIFTASQFILRDYIDTAFKLVQLSQNLEGKIECELINKGYLVNGSMVNHFRFPINTSSNWLVKGYQTSLEVGDMNFAFYSIAHLAFTNLFGGKTLDETLKQVERSIDFGIKIKKLDFAEMLQAFAKLINYLHGKVQLQIGDIEKIASTPIANKGYQARLICIALGFSFYLNDSIKMLQYGEAFYENWLQFVNNFYLITEYYLFYVFGILDCYYAKSPLVKSKHWSHFKAIAKQFALWAKHCEANYMHLDLVLKAEKARLDKKENQALFLYDQAVEAARKHGFIQYVAIICERASKYSLEIHRDRRAKTYIQEAHSYYLRWGAQIKAKELELAFPQWLASASAVISESTSTVPQATFDILAISKATQAISEEIIRENLLTRIIEVVLQSAAAQRVIILEGNPLKVIAEGDKGQVTVYQGSEPSKDKLPLSIPAYVLRTKQPIVLDDASQHPEQFQNEPYLKMNEIKSVLCAPIVYQSEVKGILYLENNAVPYAFTHDRLVVLNILSGQIAISLENARFYERSHELYKSTERFVPKPFLEMLHKENIEEVKLGDGVEQEISVLFTDLRGFTTITQTLTPKETFEIVNHYLEYMAPIIRAHHGFINQYQGDGILALFPRKADDALTAGIAMLSALQAYNNKEREVGGILLDMGVGINTGPAMMGIIGEKERMEPTVLSDAANIGSRVETLNKTYGTHLLFSHDTYRALENPDHFALRRVDKVYLKGRDESTNLYEVIDWSEKLHGITVEDYLTHFYNAFELYEGGQFERAKQQFSYCLEFYPEDQVAKLLQNRCDILLASGTPSNWDGTFIMTHK